ncbi:MAG: hypothetical protein ABL940_01000 [Bacteroidia bacterium]
MNKFLSILLVLLAMCAFAQAGNQVLIMGKAPQLANKTIAAYTVTDYFSENKKSISPVFKIDDEGNFELKFPLQELTYVTCISNGYKFDLYCTPNKVYTISIAPNDSTLRTKVNAEVYLNYSIKCNDEYDLNKLVTQYTYTSDVFFSTHFMKITQRMATMEIDSLKKATTAKYAPVKNAYFNTYLYYANALLEYECVRTTKKFNRKFMNNIALDNRAYVDFFKEFYANKLDRETNTISGEKLLTYINNYKSYTAVNNYFKKDTLLTNDTLRALVCINGLYECLYKRGYNNTNLLEVLQNASDSCNIPALQNIAKQYIIKYNRGKVGAKINLEYTLINETLDTIALSKYSGKYICLAVGNSRSADYWQEMRLVPRLINLYGRNINFVSLAIDDNYAKTLAIKKQNKYTWPFLNANNAHELLDALNLRAIPSFYILSYDGTLLLSSGSKPSDLLERNIQGLRKGY